MKGGGRKGYLLSSFYANETANSASATITITWTTAPLANEQPSQGIWKGQNREEINMGDVFITDKIHNRLRERAKQEEDVKLEGLVGVLLVLALDNEATVKRAIQIIKDEQLGGATDMARKDW